MLKSVISGIKWTTLSSITQAVVSILRISILARLLESSAFGLIAITTLILGISRLFMDMGISVAILHRQNISNEEYSTLYTFNILLGCLLYLIVLAVTPLVSLFYTEPELNFIIPLMGITIVLAVFGLQPKVILRKELQFRTIEIIEILSIILSFIFAITLAYHGYGVYALVYSLLAQFALANGLYVVIGLGNRPFVPRLNWKELVPFLKIGGYQTGGQILNYFSSQFDTIIIGKMLGFEVLGAYSLIKNLASRPVSIINPVVNKVAAPVLAKYQNDSEKLKNYYLYLVKLISLINFPLYFGGAVLATPLIAIVYGVEYTAYSNVFSLLCIYMALRSIGNSVGNLVIATGRTSVEFKWNIIVLITMPIAVAIASAYNLETVALALFLLMLSYLFLAFFLMIKPLSGVSFYCFFANIRSALVSSVFMAIVILYFSNFFSDHVYSLLMGTSVGIIIYMLSLIILEQKLSNRLFNYLRTNRFS